MKKNKKADKEIFKDTMRKCGAITCMNNVLGQCSQDECELCENVLIQEH